MPPPPERAVSGRRWLIGGRVQGVGFQPFVCGLADQLRLCGSVRNQGGQIEIVVWSDARTADRFLEQVLSQHPAVARPDLVSVTLASTPMAPGFHILPSADGAEQVSLLPPLILRREAREDKQPMDDS